MMQRPGRRSQADLEAQDPRVALADCQKALREAQDRCAQLEADRVRLESILEGSQDAIWSWNTDGVVVRWNAAAKRASCKIHQSRDFSARLWVAGISASGWGGREGAGAE